MHRQTVIATLIAGVISLAAGAGAGYWAGFKAGEGQFVYIDDIESFMNDSCPPQFRNEAQMAQYTFLKKRFAESYCDRHAIEQAKRSGAYNRILCGTDVCPPGEY